MDLFEAVCMNQIRQNMWKWVSVVFQWRVQSKWHGWSVRQGRGEGDCHSRLLHEHEIQNLLHELWKWSHNLNYRIILFREIEKPHLRLWMILIVVSWDTSCLGRHSLGLSLLRNLFWFVGPQGSRLSQGSIFPDSRPLLQLCPHSCHLVLTSAVPVGGGCRGSGGREIFQLNWVYPLHLRLLLKSMFSPRLGPLGVGRGTWLVFTLS